MAISGVNKKKQQEPGSSSASFTKPASGNHPPFRATGLGWFNKYPNFAANIANANASLTNRATSRSNDDLYKTWLFVNAVETGWKLAGETGQGQLGRVFYPRNMSQDQLAIEGIVASQFEYDKLVEFVQHHHFSQIRPQGAVAQSLDGNTYPSVDFALFKPANTHTFDGFQPLRYSVVIENIEAGHERFKNFPTYVLTCKVVYDYLGPRYEIQQAIRSRIRRQQIFGNASNPVPATDVGGNSSTVQANAYLNGQKKIG